VVVLLVCLRQLACRALEWPVAVRRVCLDSGETESQVAVQMACLQPAYRPQLSE